VFGRSPTLLVLVLAVAAGLVGGAFATVVQERHRAETTLVVERGTRPLGGGSANHGLVQTLATLMRSDVVTANVIQNLSLHEEPSELRDRISVATVGDTSLLRVRVSGDRATEAKRLAQELALVFSQLVRDRFGQGGARGSVAVAVFDPAHAVEAPSVAGNLAWGALLGVLVGAAAVSLWPRRGVASR